jgi:hypothetical protein
MRGIALWCGAATEPTFNTPECGVRSDQYYALSSIGRYYLMLFALLVLCQQPMGMQLPMGPLLVKASVASRSRACCLC